MKSSPLRLSWCILGALLGAACGGDSGDPPVTEDAAAPADLALVDAGAVDGAPAVDAAAPPGPPVACGAVLPGPPMKADLVEAQPGYAAAAAALDLTTVPDPYDYAGLASFQKGVVNWMLGRATGTRVTRAEALAAGGLGQAVLAAVAQGGGTLDFTFLRRGLQYYYPCSRPVPRDLAELRARYGDYSTWPSSTVDCSKPKDGPRRLRVSTAQGVYVAETLVNGQVRETEVLFERLRGDGQLDFAAYTDGGALTDRSTFATASSSVTSGAPYTCLSCHFDRVSGAFNVRLPSGTGAGCRTALTAKPPG